MSVSLHCLKRFPLVSFPRYYASASVARSSQTVPSSSEDAQPKKRASRAKKPKVEAESKPPPPPNILEWTSVQEHLDKLAATNGQLVLADIERCRPASHAPPGTPTYELQYKELVEKITGSFTVQQLRKFLKLYEIPLPSKSKKEECAIAIMENQWTWPSLAAIRERERQTETDIESGPLFFSPQFRPFNVLAPSISSYPIPGIFSPRKRCDLRFPTTSHANQCSRWSGFSCLVNQVPRSHVVPGKSSITAS